MTAITYVDPLGHAVTEYTPLVIDGKQVCVEHTDSPTGFLAFGSGCWCGQPAVFHVTSTRVTGGGTSHWYRCPKHLNLQGQQ